MPLLHGAQVSPLPLPRLLEKLSPKTEVWVMDQTAEIFLDYESYANRYIFYSQSIFTPNVPKAARKPGSVPFTTFFESLEIEHNWLDRLIRSEFPESLKHRLVVSLLTYGAQREPTFERLIAHLYRLHHDRFDVGEKVIVDLTSDQPPSACPAVYSARVAKVIQTKSPRPDGNLPTPLFPQPDHIPSYLYAVQITEDGKTSARPLIPGDPSGRGYMKVDPSKLSRHPDTFSKALLKRFIQSVLLPMSSDQSLPRWKVKPDILHRHQISDGSTSSSPLEPVCNPIKPPKRSRAPPVVTTSDCSLSNKKRKSNDYPDPHRIPRLPPSYQDYLQCSPDLVKPSNMSSPCSRWST